MSKATLPPAVLDSKLREQIEAYVLEHYGIHIIPENRLEHFLLVVKPRVREWLWAALSTEQLVALCTQQEHFDTLLDAYAVEIATGVWSREFPKRYPTGDYCCENADT